MSERDPNPSIADLNDEFRRMTRSVLITPGILKRDDALDIILAVRSFNDFHADNDPWHEHDMAMFPWHEVHVLWKIDTYDPDMQHGAEDPFSPDAVRMLTVMLSSEY